MDRYEHFFKHLNCLMAEVVTYFLPVLVVINAAKISNAYFLGKQATFHLGYLL